MKGDIVVYNGSTLGSFLRDSTLWFERNVVGDATIGHLM